MPGVPLFFFIIVGHCPNALAVVADEDCLDISSFSPSSLSLRDGPILTEILSQRAVKLDITN